MLAKVLLMICSWMDLKVRLITVIRKIWKAMKINIILIKTRINITGVNLLWLKFWNLYGNQYADGKSEIITNNVYF